MPAPTLVKRYPAAALATLLLPLAALGLAIRAAGPPAVSGVPPLKAAWTVMIYMAADCDLEACQVNNLESMLEIGSSHDVNVVVFIDRSTKGEEDAPVAPQTAADDEHEPKSAPEPRDEDTSQRPPAGHAADKRDPASADSANPHEDKPGEVTDEKNSDKKDNDKKDSDKTDNEKIAAEKNADKTSEEDIFYTNRPLANLGNWTGARVLYLRSGKLEQIADWGDVNSGDPAVLRRFIVTAMQKYPAVRYGLILNDHGMGWAGVCHDEPRDDILTTPELRRVLAQTTRRSGRLELLGFDACLMANFEICQSLGPFTRVIVASEELEPGEGWNYLPLLRGLQIQPTTNGIEAGQLVAETFRKYFEDNQDAALAGMTLSVIRSDELAAVERAVDRLADALRAQLASDPDASWLKIARARSRTVEYGREESREGAAQLDLVHLAIMLGKEFPGSEIESAGLDVAAAVDAAVVRNVHSIEHPNSHGMTIFFPPTREIFEDDVDVSYRWIEYSRRGRWCRWLADYVEQAEQQRFHPLLQELRVTSTRVSKKHPISVVSGVQHDQYAEVYLAVAGAAEHDRTALAQLSTYPDEFGVLDNEWDGRWYKLQSGEQRVLCPTLICAIPRVATNRRTTK